MALFDYLKPQFMADPKFPVLVSFPRTGSHWLRMIMEKYLMEPSLVRSFYYDQPQAFWGIHLHDINTRLRDRENVIYLYREPVDTLYSEMTMNRKNFAQNIDHYIMLYSNHVYRWLYNRDDIKNMHVITYENMKVDAPTEVAKVIKWLGRPLFMDRIQECCEEVNKDKVKERTQHDPGVINRAPDYEKCRVMFREKYGQYILDKFKEKDSRLVW